MLWPYTSIHLHHPPFCCQSFDDFDSWHTPIPAFYCPAFDWTHAYQFCRRKKWEKCWDDVKWDFPPSCIVKQMLNLLLSACRSLGWAVFPLEDRPLASFFWQTLLPELHVLLLSRLLASSSVLTVTSAFESSVQNRKVGLLLMYLGFKMSELFPQLNRGSFVAVLVKTIWILVYLQSKFTAFPILTAWSYMHSLSRPSLVCILCKDCSDCNKSTEKYLHQTFCSWCTRAMKSAPLSDLQTHFSGTSIVQCRYCSNRCRSNAKGSTKSLGEEAASDTSSLQDS